MTNKLQFQPPNVGDYTIDLKLGVSSPYNIYSFKVTVYQNTPPKFSTALVSPQNAYLGVNTLYTLPSIFDPDTSDTVKVSQSWLGNQPNYGFVSVFQGGSGYFLNIYPSASTNTGVFTLQITLSDGWENVY